VTGLVLVASDLDRTLIYSRAAFQLSEHRPSASEGGAERRGNQLTTGELPLPSLPPLRCVEQAAGDQLSFMTRTASKLLVQLAAGTVFVPVTTRVPQQLARVRLPVRSEYAVAANGGFILVDNVIDAGWSRQVQGWLRQVTPLDEVWRHVSETCRPDWTVKLRDGASMFCYAVLDRTRVPAGFLDEAAGWAAARGWRTSMQGRKLYWLPQPLTKSAAVAEITDRTGAGTVLAAGDSLLDLDLLAAADLGIHPRHGELAETGWSAERVCRTAASGLLAGEEICRWFVDRLAQAG
jgi:hypothetical protein